MVRGERLMWHSWKYSHPTGWQRICSAEDRDKAMAETIRLHGEEMAKRNYCFQLTTGQVPPEPPRRYRKETP